MKIKHILLSALMLGLMAVSARAQDEVLVDAAASLKDAITELAPLCLKDTGVKLTPNLAASGLLARQIESGAPGDLFISADEPTMDGLEKDGLLAPGTRVSLLGNALVVVVPAQSTLKIESPKDLDQPAIKHLAIGEPKTVPAGASAQQFFDQEKISDAVKPKLVPLENVRAVLTAVTSGNADAGLVYITDAHSTDQVKIAFTVPPSDKLKITYPLAILKNTKVAAAAAKVREFLLGDKARAVFVRYGFIVLPSAAKPAAAAPPAATTPK
jgi:molybdate transport system substrate-binding protein